MTSFNDPVHLSPAGHIPGDGPLEPEPEPMCVECKAAPPAEYDDDGYCIECAVRWYTQHPDEFDDTPERYFGLSADLAEVRDRVCMERARARGLLIEKPLIAVPPGPTEAHREASGIIAAASVEAAKAGKVEVAELLLRAAKRMKDAA